MLLTSFVLPVSLIYDMHQCSYAQCFIRVFLPFHRRVATPEACREPSSSSPGFQEAALTSFLSLLGRLLVTEDVRECQLAASTVEVRR